MFKEFVAGLDGRSGFERGLLLQTFCSMNSKGKSRDGHLSHLKITEKMADNYNRIARTVLIDMKKLNLKDTYGLSYQDLMSMDFGEYSWLIELATQMDKEEKEYIKKMTDGLIDK